ncbi:MAG: NAD(P)-dependent dehydrogenase (short-subunit alcohol dehydrogenase family) [Planctomycetota bacterium]|jgi:NAD(P)-dependent dehydrogenase (short-subunit alcohol dehydrogenase family)
MSNNKVAIVSGGATLIGQKVALALHDDGCKIVICDINVEDGEAFVKELGDDAIFVKADITSDEDIDNCIAQAISTFGGVDYLVNLAATYLDNGFESTREEWQSALNTNVISGAMFTEKIAPHMQSRGGGAVVFFGSISAKIAQPGRMLYAASKAAIVGMTRNMALHLAPMKIRANSVSPGWVWSNPIRDFSGNDRAKADRVGGPMHMLNRIVDAEEVGNTVAFLCSDKASGITGSDIAVDGGYTAMGPEQAVDKLPQLAE